ncbi:MAG: HD domain-containing protein [Oscillospiraceae bacterium]|nr:HD domain-containing protein [Oscillospiraceae bacterium]MBR1899151.1 HD domain-containing protein [Oscillospiraceae bacterium]
MLPVNDERLAQQLAFLLELDKLKNIYRQTYVLHEDRKENDAEHSYHLAVMAAVLAEHAAEPVDVVHVMKMVLIHDVVEIDAGDTYAYDTAGNATKRERELAAAGRLFALLPPDQAAEYRTLWDEFEARETPEARFAVTLDRIQPLLLNYTKGGISWTERGIRAGQVEGRNRSVTEEGSPALGALCYRIIAQAKEEGLLK